MGVVAFSVLIIFIILSVWIVVHSYFYNKKIAAEKKIADEQVRLRAVAQQKIDAISTSLAENQRAPKAPRTEAEARQRLREIGSSFSDMQSTLSRVRSLRPSPDEEARMIKAAQERLALRRSEKSNDIENRDQ